MLKPKTLSRIGAVIALFSLVALPLASCGEARITGVDLLFRVEGFPLLKLLVLVSLIAAVLAFFFTGRGWQLALGTLGGLAVALGFFLVANDKSAATEVRGGSIFAIIGFLLVLIPGLLRPGESPPKKRST